MENSETIRVVIVGLALPLVWLLYRKAKHDVLYWWNKK